MQIGVQRRRMNLSLTGIPPMQFHFHTFNTYNLSIASTCLFKTLNPQSLFSPIASSIQKSNHLYHFLYPYTRFPLSLSILPICHSFPLIFKRPHLCHTPRRRQASFPNPITFLSLRGSIDPFHNRWEDIQVAEIAEDIVREAEKAVATDTILLGKFFVPISPFSPLISSAFRAHRFHRSRSSSPAPVAGNTLRASTLLLFVYLMHSIGCAGKPGYERSFCDGCCSWR